MTERGGAQTQSKSSPELRLLKRGCRMRVKAVVYVRAIQEGWSKPLLFRCDDGKEYVVKLMNNPQGLRVLPNELIAYRLGRLLKLPVGKCAIVHISKELIKSFPSLKVKQLTAGPHIGSLYYQEAKPLNDVQDLIGCENLREAAGMIAFDHWIQNWDRADNSSNILVLKQADRKKIIMIDHANAFTGHWTIDSLKINRREPSAYWGSSYELFLPYIDNENPFREILQRIYALNKADLWTTMFRVPKEWQLSYKEQQKMVKYLEYRKAAVSAGLEKLKNCFTDWK